MIEVWKDIPGFENIYQSSTHGRVKRISKGPSTHIGRVLKLQTHHSGYINVCLCKDGKQYKSLTVHALILQTFVGPKPEGTECRHLDGNRNNNHLNNLSWGTHSDNMQDRNKHGNYKSYRGSQCCISKLTELQVLEIKRLLSSTQKYKHNKQLTLKEIAEYYKVSITTISYIKTGKIWKHVEK